VSSEHENGPQAPACGPYGGLFGIDQEVVTLKRSIPHQRRTDTVAPSADSGSWHDLNARRNIPNSPVELRSTQSNRSKSQPPHLVY